MEHKCFAPIELPQDSAVNIKKKDVGVCTSRPSLILAFALPLSKMSNAASPRRDDIMQNMDYANTHNPTKYRLIIRKE